jgi:hypothetical protein
MGFSRIQLKEKILYVLVNRMVIFLFVMCLLTLSLYAAGTIQDFIDSTQLSLLQLYEVLGIFLMLTSLCGIMLNIGRFFKIKKARYLLRAGGYLILVAYSIASVLAVMTIIALSRGSGFR